MFDTVELGQGFLPPDTTGDIGPNHFVQAVNVAFRVFSRDGIPLTPLVALGDLFSNVPEGCFNDGSPQVIYDQLADRWLIEQGCSRGRERGLVVAVSKTPDPTGEFYLYRFKSFNTKIIASAKLGVWPDAYYLGALQIKKIGVGFRGSGFYALDRKKMLSGNPSASMVYVDSCPENVNCLVFGPLPFDVDGFLPPPEGSPGMFVLFTANDFQDPEGDGLRFWDFQVDFDNPDNSMLVERVGSPMQVSEFDPVTRRVPQPLVTSSAHLESLTSSLMFRAAYRNLGTGTESLILNHTVDALFDGHIGVRYYQLDRTGPDQPFLLVEEQTFSPDETWRWAGSGAMNHIGDTAIGFSVSSATVFPSIRYAARFANDVPGTGLAQGEQTIIEGGGSQFSTTRRWGSYSQMSIDPLDDCSFWYTTEYYENSNTNGWQTRIAKFLPRECSPPPSAAIEGTVSVCGSGEPIDDVRVDATGGFSRNSGSSGQYSMRVVPGTYDLQASKNGFAGDEAQAVSVANGQTAVRDFCVTPIAEVAVDEVTVTVGNNVLEPNECNTLKIVLKNTGALPANNVTATLSSETPGVTIEEAVSEYPDLAAKGGSGTNLSLYKIRTDASLVCYTQIDLRLSVDFEGGNSPVDVDFTMKVGRDKGPNYTFSSSLNNSLEPGGEIIPGSNEGPGLFNVPSPFDFTLYGRQVRTGDILKVNKYGVVEVATTDPTPFGGNNRLPTTQFESPVAVLLPMWDDLDIGRSGINGDGVFLRLFGEEPNRTFQIEWRGRINPDVSFGDVDTIFGVQLHENSDDFEYIYELTGAGSRINGASATIGVQGDSYGQPYTEFSYNHPMVVFGTKLEARRPPAVCSQGTGQCGGVDTTHVRFDFDGDARTDASIFRPSPGSIANSASPEGSSSQWWYLRSGDLGTKGFVFGHANDIPAPADITGDGKTDVAFFRSFSGFWYVLRSEDDTFFSFQFGSNGDIPVPGDYDGDGKADPAVFRPSTATWFIFRSSDSQVMTVPFGVPEDKPVVADYDGDGKDDIAVYRPSVSQWWQLRSSEGVKAYEFGFRNDRTAVGDWTGDGRDDIALFRPSTGFWFVIRSEDDSFYSFPWGSNGDIPTPGDYDGDGRYDPAIWRPSESVWYILGSTGGFNAFQFGSPGDVPLPSTVSYQ
ncbi:MAG: carboxypeptidase regulatory-like domain-containing protein [Aridibacter famidurans]|nr:carboxypeptidase regulatory-like domain-containing protein [Aridibacter famidurans]